MKRQETRAAAMEEKKSDQGLHNDVIEENMQVSELTQRV